MVKNKKQQKQSKMLLIFFLLCLVGLAALFLSAALIITIGMIPTAVAFLVNKKSMRFRALTVGALNFSGCYPFLIELAQHGYSLDKAFNIILDPFTIVIVFSAAGVGYAIDWAVSNIASSVLYQKSLSRRQAIKKQQEALVERWGENVTGDVALDEHGFPTESY